MVDCKHEFMSRIRHENSSKCLDCGMTVKDKKKYKEIKNELQPSGCPICKVYGQSCKCLMKKYSDKRT